MNLREKILTEFQSWDSEKQLHEFQAYKQLNGYSPLTESDYSLMEQIMNNSNASIDCEAGNCSISYENPTKETIPPIEEPEEQKDEPIAEKTDLTKQRKATFEGNKTVDNYREYYSVLSKSEQEKLSKKMKEAGYLFTSEGIKKDDVLLKNTDMIEFDLVPTEEVPPEDKVQESKEETQFTYGEYLEFSSKKRKSLRRRIEDNGFTFEKGRIIDEDGKALFNSYRITLKALKLEESTDKITLGMIKDIELIDGDDKNYFVSYSSKYAETPEHDELPKSLIRKLLKDNNVDAEEFWDNFIPYLDKKEAQVVISDIFGDEVTL